MSLRIEISNEHAFPLDEARLKKGVRAVLKDAGHLSKPQAASVLGEYRA